MNERKQADCDDRGLLSARRYALPASGNLGNPILQAFPAYDGNGNIIAWTDENGSIQHRIDYDGFGNKVMEYGAWSAEERIRYGFSTKPEDVETGLLYYGYRYYDPVTGRWPSRDPIGERGGINLYGMVGNDALNWWDYLGLEEGAKWVLESSEWGEWEFVNARFNVESVALSGLTTVFVQFEQDSNIILEYEQKGDVVCRCVSTEKRVTIQVTSKIEEEVWIPSLGHAIYTQGGNKAKIATTGFKTAQSMYKNLKKKRKGQKLGDVAKELTEAIEDFMPDFKEDGDWEDPCPKLK
ncbi:MAG: RHS repeat domain-containing protein [Verrucomicrobiaceae bacterium]